MDNIKDILNKFKNNELDLDKASELLETINKKDLGYAVIDNHRQKRVGYPEVIYSKGKTKEQILGIMKYMDDRGDNVLATRASLEQFQYVKNVLPGAEYNETARTITLKNKEIKKTDSYIGIISAGTSDLPVLEEAAVTAEFFGNRIEKIFDVGVAGIHRVFGKIEKIQNAKVLIVVAGMEGALASVIGGLVDKPVIAVPTSVGYGANFQGLSALLSMLNSCANGVSVVNIDNGFGAAYIASMINKL